MKKEKFHLISYIFQLAAGSILLMAAWFKLSGAEESVALFGELGIPGTRTLIGILEAACGLCLVTNYLAHFGAALSFSIMLGAIIAHVTVLGVKVNNDGGLLFGLLFVVLICDMIVMWFHRKKLPVIGHTF